MDGPSVGDKSASSFEKSRDPRSVPSIKKANARSIFSCLYVFQIVKRWTNPRAESSKWNSFFRKKKFARQTFERILSSLHFTSSTVTGENREEKSSEKFKSVEEKKGCRAQLPAERTKARIRRNRAWRGKSVSETGEGGGEKSGQLARDRGNLFLFL